MIRMNPAHDIQHPPGCRHYSPDKGPISPAKRLGDIIDAVVARSSEPASNRSEEYAKGFIDGKAEGFKEGLAWATGKGV